MGVYLYGELMVQEDARQQTLARRCLSIIKDDMDQSARSVVEEMILWTQTNQVRFIISISYLLLNDLLCI